MTAHDDLHLRQRLRSLGEGPVPGSLQAEHLASMTGASAARRPSGFWTKARVGLAFLAGLLLGGSGLATAGALPDRAQDVAHDVFGAVGMHVPEGRSQAGCDEQGPHEGLYANHGEFVSKAARGDVGDTTAADAAKTECGKPIGAGGPGADAGPAGSDNPCRPPWAGGKPAWAGPGTEQEKAAARDEAKAGFTPSAECDDEAEELEAEAEAGIEPQSEAGPPAEEPAGPGVPADPADPADPPGDPGSATEPADPAEPAEPADPVDPEPTGDPAEPAEDDPLVEE